jgi:cytochrome c5
MISKIVLFTFAVALLFSCASKTPSTNVVVIQEVKKVELTKELAEGKELYESNCVRCHKLYEPSKFTKEDWKPIVARMQKKAHLDDMLGNSIYNYVSSYAK